MDLTEAQWQVLKPLLTPKRRPDGRGRPWRDARAVLNGILWVLRTGAPWHDLPDRYPPYQTCHRRFQQWQRDGTLTRLLHALAEDLRARGKLDLSETFIDASFSSAKKGALLSARLAAEKAVKSWRSQTAMVFLSPAVSPALHTSQTRTNDRGPRLRQRSARPTPAAKTRHSAHFRYILSQRPLARLDGKGRVAVIEILKSTMRTREYIEKGESEGKSLLDAMRDGSNDGMQHFDAEIEKLIREGVIDVDTGLTYATNA